MKSKTLALNIVISIAIIIAALPVMPAGKQALCRRNPVRCQQQWPDYCGGRDGTKNNCPKTGK